MALLVGTETEGTEAAGSATPEIGQAFQFTVVTTGTAEEIHCRFSSGFTGTMKMALIANEGTKPKNKTVLQEVSKEFTGATEMAIPLTPLEVTSGTVLWLAFCSSVLSGKFKRSATSQRCLMTVKKATLAEGEWGTNKTEGPMAIWVSGTASGGGTPVTGKASGAILLTGTAKGSAFQVVTGKATGPLLLAGTSKGQIAGAVQAQASGAIVLTGTARGQAAGGIFAKATGTLNLAGSSKSTVTSLVKGKAAGTVLLAGTSTGTRRSVISAIATGTILLAGKGHANAGASITGKAQGTLLLAGLARVTAESPEVWPSSGNTRRLPALGGSHVLYPSTIGNRR